MAYTLHENAVITGSVNTFCLACDISLETEHEAYCHIESLSHCDNISLTPYSDKYKDHYIRKFKTGYYCAFCNVLLSTAVNVETHLTEEDHRQNRGNTLLKSLDHNIIAFNDVLIKDSVWHALKDNVCSLCDSEFEDENLHKSEAGHALNLIKKSIKFGANDSIYRHINESIVQCLTCDVILSTNAVIAHFDANDHIILYENAKMTAVDANNTPKHTGIDKNNSEILIDNHTIQNNNKYEEESVTEIMNFLETYQSNNIDVKFEIDLAFCRKCCEVIKFNRHDIESHIEKHNEPILCQKPRDIGYNNIYYSDDVIYVKGNTDPQTSTSHALYKGIDDSNSSCDSTKSNTTNSRKDMKLLPETEKLVTASCKSEFKNDILHAGLSTDAKNSEKNKANVDRKSDEEETRKIAKDNCITYNTQNVDAFCRICQVRVPSSLNCIKEHIKGNNHNKNRANASQVKEPRLKKQKTKIFINKFSAIENIFRCDIIINKKYYMSNLSFFLMIKKDNACMECLLCKMRLPYMPLFYKAAAGDHYLCHAQYTGNIPVITSVSSEFIREIRQGEFHCGCCNIIVTGWNEMEKHLQSSDHRQQTVQNTCRLLDIIDLL